MAEPHGDKLFVNLAASQARRRLQGFGHGVRKIQSGGRNQAVIIHTAYGRHLKELQAKFADVGFAGSESDLGQPVDNLKNIGSVIAMQLREVGIRTIADLERVGPVAVYRQIALRHPQRGLNLLWVLAGGLNDQDWQALSPAIKDRLRRELDAK